MPVRLKANNESDIRKRLRRKVWLCSRCVLPFCCQGSINCFLTFSFYLLFPKTLSPPSRRRRPFRNWIRGLHATPYFSLSLSAWKLRCQRRAKYFIISALSLRNYLFVRSAFSFSHFLAMLLREQRTFAFHNAAGLEPRSRLRTQDVADSLVLILVILCRIICVNSRVHKFVLKLKTHSKISIIRSDSLLVSTDFIRFSLTMAYGIGRNIALLEWKINWAEFLWTWNKFIDSI